MPATISLVDVRCGRLTVTEQDFSNKQGWHWKCRCDCGKTVTVSGSNLRRRRAQSCGCLSRERSAEAMRLQFTTHGHTVGKRIGRPWSSEYAAWASMIQRCTNPKASGWSYYGGRGVSVCPEWKSSFEAFYKHMGRKPSKSHSLDRIDVNGNYEPGNVRWATKKEQRANRRDSLAGVAA